jgi:FixJ family two-component response regulator
MIDSVFCRLSPPQRGIFELKKAGLISVIDDDVAVRNSTKTLLRSLGYSVATFASAEEFLSSDRLPDTSCVITDIRMSGMSGFDLHSRLKARGDRTPVIFMTAFPEAKLQEQAMAGGAHGFLLKPYREESLIDYVRSALQA